MSAASCSLFRDQAFDNLFPAAWNYHPSIMPVPVWVEASTPERLKQD